jgi:Acetyltransferase (GNAT) domain
MFKMSIITSKDYDEFMGVLRLRYAIFSQELSYVKRNYMYDLLKMEFDEFDQDAYFVVLKDDDEMVGSARLNFGGHLPFNTKSDIGLYYPFSNLNNNIEVTKLMIRRDKRNSKSILLVLNAILKFIRNKDYSYVFTDVFKDSVTHGLLQKIGFKQLDYQYIDEYFTKDTPSLVLYMSKAELEVTTTQNSKISKMVF